MAKYLDQGAAPRFVTAGKKRRTAQQYFAGCLWHGANSAEQEDAGAGDRSKATCSTASCEHALHSLSSPPLELPYSRSSPSAAGKEANEERVQFRSCPKS